MNIEIKDDLIERAVIESCKTQASNHAGMRVMEFMHTRDGIKAVDAEIERVFVAVLKDELIQKRITEAVIARIDRAIARKYRKDSEVEKIKSLLKDANQ